MVVALLALRRIAVTPSLPGPGLERQDRAWRVESTRIVINVLTASLALQLGGVAVFAGDAIRNAAITPEEPFDMHTFGVALLVIGIVALAFSVIWFTLAAVRAFELPHTVAAEVATESTTQEAMDDDHARSL